MARLYSLPAAALVLTLSIATVVALSTPASTTTTTTSTTTTTVPLERAQAGWSVASRSARGVMVDYRTEVVGAGTFTVLRLRARTTLLRWHIGSIDPPVRAGLVPVDAGPAIFWPSEGLAGVVAVFNGGFKQNVHSGGAVVDGVRVAPLIRGDMTIAIDAAGHWAMGIWGSATFPAPGFDAVAYRQNLGPLVQNGALVALANTPNVSLWGSPLGGVALEPRTGLGVDARGNLIFVATMKGVDVAQVGIALLRAGAVTGMELDMNPYWPILGAARAALHAPGGVFAVQLPYSEHNPSIYETGWQRDFFVALAEPNSWNCDWASAGVKAALNAPQAQRLHLVGRGCTTTTTTTTTTSTTTSSTTTSSTSSTTTTTSASTTTTTGAN